MPALLTIVSNLSAVQPWNEGIEVNKGTSNNPQKEQSLSHDDSVDDGLMQSQKAGPCFPFAGDPLKYYFPIPALHSLLSAVRAHHLSTIGSFIYQQGTGDVITSHRIKRIDTLSHPTSYCSSALWRALSNLLWYIIAIQMSYINGRHLYAIKVDIDMGTVCFNFHVASML